MSIEKKRGGYSIISSNTAQLRPQKHLLAILNEKNFQKRIYQFPTFAFNSLTKDKILCSLLAIFFNPNQRTKNEGL